MEAKCIVAIVERGKADKIVERAKKTGAKEPQFFTEEARGKQRH